MSLESALVAFVAESGREVNVTLTHRHDRIRACSLPACVCVSRRNCTALDDKGKDNNKHARSPECGAMSELVSALSSDKHNHHSNPASMERHIVSDTTQPPPPAVGVASTPLQRAERRRTTATTVEERFGHDSADDTSMDGCEDKLKSDKDVVVVAASATKRPRPPNRVLGLAGGKESVCVRACTRVYTVAQAVARVSHIFA